MTTLRRLPLVILAGSDRRSGVVPAGMRKSDMLSGHKGAQRLPWGRCLVAEAALRAEHSGRFDPPIVVGPAEVYEGLINQRIVDVGGSLASTLARVHRLWTEEFDPEQPVAFTSCDILPTPAEWRRLIDEIYAPHADSVFWWQMVAASPEELGASGWKPVYRLRQSTRAPLQTLYPGHVLIARGEALRVRLVGQLLALAYRFRNLPLHRRIGGLTARGLWSLLCEDARNLAKGQWPVLTVGLPWRGLSGYLKYRRGAATVGDVESFLAHAFLHRRFLDRHEGRPVVVSIVDLVSLAQDIDTQGELNQVAPIGIE